jgi:hypothetical protein
VEGVKRFRAGWDWALGYSLMGLGAVLLAVASLRVSGSRYVSDQLSILVSGGLGGLVALTAGSALVLTAGLSDEWRKLDRVAGAMPFPDDVAEPSAAVLVRRGRLLAGLGILVAVVLLAVAWGRVSGEADPEPGLEAVSIGVVGLVIGGLMTALATLGLKRRLQLRKSRLFAPWVEAEEAETVEIPPASDGRVLVAHELTRYHARGCPAVKGIATREVDRADLPPALEPCDLCHTS